MKVINQRDNRKIILHSKYIEVKGLQQKYIDQIREYKTKVLLRVFLAILITVTIEITIFILLNSDQITELIFAIGLIIVGTSVAIIMKYGANITRIKIKEYLSTQEYLQENTTICIGGEVQNLSCINQNDPINTIGVLYFYEQKSNENSKYDKLTVQGYHPSYLREATTKDQIVSLSYARIVCISKSGVLYPLFAPTPNFNQRIPKYVGIAETIRDFYHLTIPKWDLVCDLGYIVFVSLTNMGNSKPNSLIIRRDPDNYYYLIKNLKDPYFIKQNFKLNTYTTYQLVNYLKKNFDTEYIENYLNTLYKSQSLSEQDRQPKYK